MEGDRNRGVIEGVNLIGVHCMCVWKYNEILLQQIYANKNVKKFTI
jgi:hypothetical protein